GPAGAGSADRVGLPSGHGLVVIDRADAGGHPGRHAGDRQARGRERGPPGGDDPGGEGAEVPKSSPRVPGEASRGGARGRRSPTGRANDQMPTNDQGTKKDQIRK